MAESPELVLARKHVAFAHQKLHSLVGMRGIWFHHHQGEAQVELGLAQTHLLRAEVLAKDVDRASTPELAASCREQCILAADKATGHAQKAIFEAQRATDGPPR